MSREIIFYLFRTECTFDVGNITQILDQIDHPGAVVVLDRDSIFSNMHLSSALMHAARSILSGNDRARDKSIEILRWVAGVHQVSRGIEIAGPSGMTTAVLVILLPQDWPNENDGSELPEILSGTWAGKSPAGLSFEGTEKTFNREAAMKKMGLRYGTDLSVQEAEMSVLERVCSPSLR